MFFFLQRFRISIIQVFLFFFFRRQEGRCIGRRSLRGGAIWLAGRAGVFFFCFLVAWRIALLYFLSFSLYRAALHLAWVFGVLHSSYGGSEAERRGQDAEGEEGNENENENSGAENKKFIGGYFDHVLWWTEGGAMSCV